MAVMEISGIDRFELAKVLETGVDPGGNPIEPFIDEEGGWGLRCCLEKSRPGEEIAIIAWSPFPWSGAYSETGPVVVHAGACEGPASADRLPFELATGPMTLRPYGFDRRIGYDSVRHVPEGEPVDVHLKALLDDSDIDFVQGRNVTGGCFAFQARRAVS